MVIKHKHPHYANSKVILPIAGEVQLENGEVDVPEEVAKIMLEHEDWISAEASDENGSKEPDETIKLDEEQKAEMIKAVEEMSHEALLETAAAAKLKGANLFKSPEKTEQLRKLVIKNIEKL